MSQPRDHHFLPVFYLDQWALNGGKLVEYSIKNSNLIAKSVGPAATAFQRDLYAFHDLPPDQVQHVERVFFDYADRVASQALRKLLNPDNTPWSAEHRSAWSRFVLGIHLRHPDAIAELRTASKAAWEQRHGPSQAAYEELRQADDPPTFEEYIERDDPLTIPRVFLNMMVKVLDNRNIGGHMNHMHWDAVDLSAAGIPLLTSDRPVQIVHLKEKNGLVAIPLGPTGLFVAANLPENIKRVRTTRPKRVVRDVNKFVASRARRFVYAPDDTQTSFVQRYMSTAMEALPLFPKTAQIGTPGFTPSE